jgi:hypothetical protein
MKLSVCPFHQPGLGCDYYATVLVGVKPAIVEETTEVRRCLSRGTLGASSGGGDELPLPNSVTL